MTKVLNLLAGEVALGGLEFQPHLLQAGNDVLQMMKVVLNGPRKNNNVVNVDIHEFRSSLWVQGHQQLLHQSLKH